MGTTQGGTSCDVIRGARCRLEHLFYSLIPLQAPFSYLALRVKILRSSYISALHDIFLGASPIRLRVVTGCLVIACSGLSPTTSLCVGQRRGTELSVPGCIFLFLFF